MRFDRTEDWLRPRELAKEEAETAVEFFKKAEIRGLTNFRAIVQRKSRAGISTNSRPYLTETYFNQYYALNDKGKVRVKFKERFINGVINRSPYDEKKEEIMELACLATARNRMRLAGDDVNIELVGFNRSFSGEKLAYLDLILEDKKVLPLTAVFKK